LSLDVVRKAEEGRNWQKSEREMKESVGPPASRSYHAGSALSALNREIKILETEKSRRVPAGLFYFYETLKPRPCSLGVFLRADPHGIRMTARRRQQTRRRTAPPDVSGRGTLLVSQLYRSCLQQPEQRGELDDRIRATKKCP